MEITEKVLDKGGESFFFSLDKVSKILTITYGTLIGFSA